MLVTCIEIVILTFIKNVLSDSKFRKPMCKNPEEIKNLLKLSADLENANDELQVYRQTGCLPSCSSFKHTLEPITDLKGYQYSHSKFVVLFGPSQIITKIIEINTTSDHCIGNLSVGLTMIN